MNPFLEKPLKVQFQNWRQLYPKAYDRRETDPYTKTRIILANGAEFEANWFSHQFSRHVCDTDLRRELALTRAMEKQQQIKISLLKPKDESALEHTISYEQLAVDLTAALAENESDCYVKKALDFALLEDFDHLYRYANLLEMEQGVPAERLVGGYTEIMPARPTISHHRYPVDNVRRCVDFKRCDKRTALATMTITAAEQQTMNYYMNVANLARTETARKLYMEIALVEEEHVTQYEDLIDANSSWLEMLLWHEYSECYLYFSCRETETDARIRGLWEENLNIELEHLHRAVDLLKRYENKDWQEVIPDGEFPAPLSLHSNIGYVRGVLESTVQFTSVLEDYEKIEELPADANFFSYQKLVNPSPSIVPSHDTVLQHIRGYGKDYRYETKENPIKELRCRYCDNTSVGRVAGAADSTRFDCNRTANRTSNE